MNLPKSASNPVSKAKTNKPIIATITKTIDIFLNVAFGVGQTIFFISLMLLLKKFTSFLSGFSRFFFGLAFCVLTAAATELFFLFV